MKKLSHLAVVLVLSGWFGCGGGEAGGSDGGQGDTSKDGQTTADVPEGTDLGNATGADAIGPDGDAAVVLNIDAATRAPDVAVGPSRAAGRVGLPAGSSLRLSDLKVVSALEEAGIAVDGAFSVLVPGAGPMLVAVSNSTGQYVALGLIDAADPSLGRLDTLGTAAYLAFRSIGAFTLPPDAWGQTMAILRTESAVQTLATVIERRLNADPSALASGDTEIKAALTTAVAALQPESATLSPLTATTEPVEVLVNSTNPSSGILVSASPQADGILLTNNYRRHLYYWLYYTGYRDTAGIDHMLSSALWQPVTEGYLKSTVALSSVLSTAINFAWQKIPYIPTTVGPLQFKPMPTDATHAYYKAVVVGSTTILGYLTPTWVEENVNALKYKETHLRMGKITTVKDFFLPGFFAFVPVAKLNAVPPHELGDLCAGVIEVLSKSGAAVETNLINKQLDEHQYAAAAETLALAVLGNGGIRKAMVAYVAPKLLAGVVADETLERMGTFAKNVNDLLKKFDQGLILMDFGAVLKDTARSRGYEQFDIKSVKPNVHIEPAAISLPGAQQQTFNVIVGTVTGDSFEYRWSVAGAGGSLRGADGTVSSTATTSVARVLYQAPAASTKSVVDKLTVEVWRKLTTDTGITEQKVGTSTADITVTSDIKVPVTFHFVDPYFWESPHTNSYGYSFGGYVVWAKYFTWPQVKAARTYNLNYHGVTATASPVGDGHGIPDYTKFVFPPDLNEWLGNYTGENYPEIPAGVEFIGEVKMEDMKSAEDLLRLSGSYSKSFEIRCKDKAPFENATITASPVF
jgi:hypothetical protein